MNIHLNFRIGQMQIIFFFSGFFLNNHKPA